MRIGLDTSVALQHHFGMTKASAIAALDAFLRESGIGASGGAASILRTPGLATARPGLVDRMIHFDYGRAANRMLTFERGAGRLGQVEVLSA